MTKTRRKAIDRAASLTDAAIILGEMAGTDEKYIKLVLAPAIVDATFDAIRNAKRCVSARTKKRIAMIRGINLRK